MDSIDLTEPKAEKSLGALVSDAATELSTLVRQEIALAKAELGESAKRVGTGVGAFGAAGVTGLLAVVFLGLAAMFGLEALGLPIGLAALAVSGALLLLTAVLGLAGKSKISSIGGAPRTARSIKEDVEWARHPTS